MGDAQNITTFHNGRVIIILRAQSSDPPRPHPRSLVRQSGVTHLDIGTAYIAPKRSAVAGKKSSSSPPPLCRIHCAELILHGPFGTRREGEARCWRTTNKGRDDGRGRGRPRPSHPLRKRLPRSQRVRHVMSIIHDPSFSEMGLPNPNAIRHARAPRLPARMGTFGHSPTHSLTHSLSHSRMRNVLPSILRKCCVRR